MVPRVCHEAIVFFVFVVCSVLFGMSVCVHHLYLLVCIIQVEVAWMMPFGPSRDTHCNTIDAIPPPPLPLSADDITIVSRDTLNVQQTSVDKQKVTASVRLVVIYMYVTISFSFNYIETLCKVLCMWWELIAELFRASAYRITSLI